ncbi:hypothetical protein B0H12DRAFT_1097283, partial [Mycena haematopus]
HLISPIHTLPVELLAEIFELRLRDYVHTYIEEMFRISQVCSDWRQVAHSTPRLWAMDTVVDLRPRRSGEEEQLYRNGLKAWLARSEPLTMSVLGHGSRVPDEILETAPRWHSLRLTPAHPLDCPPSSFFSQLAECKLESLEELSLGTLIENVVTTTLLSFTTSDRHGSGDPRWAPGTGRSGYGYGSASEDLLDPPVPV